MNERHALDKTAFSCISLFAGAFTNACRCQTGSNKSLRVFAAKFMNLLSYICASCNPC
jgi:hypothetical protein